MFTPTCASFLTAPNCQHCQVYVFLKVDTHFDTYILTHFVIGLAGHPGHPQVQLAGPGRLRGGVVGRRGLPLEPSVDGGQRCLPGRLHPQRGCAPRHGEEPPLGGGRAAPHRGAPNGALRGVPCGGQVPGRRGLLHRAAPEDQPSSRGGVHPPPGHGHGADSGGLGAATSQQSPLEDRASLQEVLRQHKTGLCIKGSTSVDGEDAFRLFGAWEDICDILRPSKATRKAVLGMRALPPKRPKNPRFS